MDAALIILDGWGAGRDWPGVRKGPSTPSQGRDAIAAANTPVFDTLLDRAAVGQLRADGETVGLPHGQMGNSQVGHLTIGAGRVVEQVSRRIDLAIESGTLGDLAALSTVFDHVCESNTRLHLWGLLSDGGVHADDAHLRSMIELADVSGLDTVVHVVTDGRDTPPRSARRFLTPLTTVVDGTDSVQIGTVSGRYFAMDRDQNWHRTRRAYEAMVFGLGSRRVDTAIDAVEAAYAVGETDEFIAPTVIDDTPPMDDGDAVVTMNFRADRARQLTRLLADIDPIWPFESDPPSLSVTTMAEYDRTFELPVVFEPIEPKATLGSVLEMAGLSQLRIAESEKYPHVTYFINGGREIQFEGEHRAIIPSPSVPTYDRQPEMSAAEVTTRALELTEQEDPAVLVLNYANPDMVGHTGVFKAVVAAIECVDRELGRLLEGLPACHVLIIADHGNAEDMGSSAEPHTAHTTNPVPCIYLAPGGDDGGYRIRDGGTLADVTPTLLTLMDLEIPTEMIGRSLLE